MDREKLRAAWASLTLGTKKGMLVDSGRAAKMMRWGYKAPPPLHPDPPSGFGTSRRLVISPSQWEVVIARNYHSTQLKCFTRCWGTIFFGDHIVITSQLKEKEGWANFLSSPCCYIQFRSCIVSEAGRIDEDAERQLNAILMVLLSADPDRVPFSSYVYAVPCPRVHWVMIDHWPLVYRVHLMEMGCISSRNVKTIASKSRTLSLRHCTFMDGGMGLYHALLQEGTFGASLALFEGHGISEHYLRKIFAKSSIATLRWNTGTAMSAALVDSVCQSKSLTRVEYWGGQLRTMHDLKILRKRIRAGNVTQITVSRNTLAPRLSMDVVTRQVEAELAPNRKLCSPNPGRVESLRYTSVACSTRIESVLSRNKWNQTVSKVEQIAPEPDFLKRCIRIMDDQPETYSKPDFLFAVLQHAPQYYAELGERYCAFERKNSRKRDRSQCTVPCENNR